MADSTTAATTRATSSFVSVNPPIHTDIQQASTAQNHQALAVPQSKNLLSSLQYKLLGDVVIAASVTACVAPFLTIIDKALVEQSAGKHSIPTSIIKSCSTMIRHPLVYLRSPTFLYMWATYACTYTAANTLRTLATHHQESNDTTTTTAAVVFVGTTTVNTTASLVKDRAYANMFGTTTLTHAIPTLTYGLWLSRDVCVISSSFLLPPHVSQATGVSLTCAQLVTPVLAQCIAGPLHYCGYDMIYHAHDRSWWNRGKRIGAQAASVIGARMARILPGYGIAGVGNTFLLQQWNHTITTPS